MEPLENVTNNTKPMEELEKTKQISQRTINTRIKRGWSQERAEQTPVRSGIFLTYNGETRTIREWEEITHINGGTIRMRMKYGWSVDRILSVPVRAIKTKKRNK